MPSESSSVNKARSKDLIFENTNASSMTLVMRGLQADCEVNQLPSHSLIDNNADEQSSRNSLQTKENEVNKAGDSCSTAKNYEIYGSSSTVAGQNWLNHGYARNQLSYLALPVHNNVAPSSSLLNFDGTCLDGEGELLDNEALMRVLDEQGDLPYIDETLCPTGREDSLTLDHASHTSETSGTTSQNKNELDSRGVFRGDESAMEHALNGPAAEALKQMAMPYQGDACTTFVDARRWQPYLSSANGLFAECTDNQSSAQSQWVGFSGHLEMQNLSHQDQTPSGVFTPKSAKRGIAGRGSRSSCCSEKETFSKFSHHIATDFSFEDGNKKSASQGCYQNITETLQSLSPRRHPSFSNSNSAHISMPNTHERLKLEDFTFTDTPTDSNHALVTGLSPSNISLNDYGYSDVFSMDPVGSNSMNSASGNYQVPMCDNLITSYIDSSRPIRQLSSTGSQLQKCQAIQSSASGWKIHHMDSPSTSYAGRPVQTNAGQQTSSSPRKRSLSEISATGQVCRQPADVIRRSSLSTGPQGAVPSSGSTVLAGRNSNNPYYDTVPTVQNHNADVFLTSTTVASVAPTTLTGCNVVFYNSTMTVGQGMQAYSILPNDESQGHPQWQIGANSWNNNNLPALSYIGFSVDDRIQNHLIRRPSTDWTQSVNPSSTEPRSDQNMNVINQNMQNW